MLIVPLIRNAQQIALKAHLSGSALVTARQQDGFALRIEGVGYTHAPPSASNRNSFMFAWREPLSVSACGLPSCGPSSLRIVAEAFNFSRTA